MNPKRKDPCPCGSGKRYKHCCGATSRGLAAQAQDAEAFFRQARLAHAAGQLEAAATAYNWVLALNPAHAEAVHNLGMLALATGDVARAQALVERSISMRPGDADFWSNCAMVYEMQEDWPRVRGAYERSLALTGSHARCELGLANALRRMGEIEQAIAHYRQSVKLAPAHWLAWMDLGTALMRKEPPDNEGAEACFREVIRLIPNQGIGYNCLGVALVMQDRYDEAKDALQRAVSLDPAQAAAWYNLARMYLLRDDVNHAIEAYQKAVALAPDDEDFHHQTARALQMRGKFDVAEQFYAKALELNPESLSALAHLIEYKKFESPDDPLLVQAQTLVDGARDNAPQVVGLCFTLGKILDRMNEFERAFRYYARGNRLRMAAIEAKDTPDRLAGQADKVIQRYSAEKLQAYQAWGNLSERPILIVGMPRSGTTLTEQIIAAHPRVAGGGERGYWAQVRNRIDAGEIVLDQAGIDGLARDYLADLATVVGAETADRVTDKMPHNFLNIGLIHAVFPNARIIHVRRNPVDNCLSIFFQGFNDSHAYSFDLEELASHYREYQRVMAHWRKLIPKDRLFEFGYEDLVADQEGMSRRLIEFCGMEWDDACLSYYENDRAVKTASIWQVRQKIYSSSVERWRNYEPYIAPLMRLLPDA